MQINLRDLAQAPEQTICFDYTIDLSKEEVNFDFPFKNPINVFGRLQDKSGVVELSADVDAEVFTNCARCNKPLSYEKYTPVFFILVKSLSDEDASDDFFLLESDIVDIDDIVVSELILSMEMSALCSDDCKGLCPKCGANLNGGDCSCERREIDPRLAVLAKLLDKKD